MNSSWSGRIAGQVTRRPVLTRLLEWALLPAGLLLALWLATQRNDAPQLILLALLYVISINFSVPLAGGVISPVLPVVVVSSVLTTDWPLALLVLAAGFLLAEFARPLWWPLWHNTPLAQLSRAARAGRAAIHLLSLALGGWLYQAAGGATPLPPQTASAGPFPAAIVPVLYLSGGYALALVLLSTLFWRWRGRPAGNFSGNSVLYLVLVALLTQPFALFGALTFANLGLPGFVMFSIGAGAFAMLIWLSWQRHHTLQQQLNQFAQLNTIGISLRETLELPTVLAQIHRQVSRLVDCDQFYIALRDEQGQWQQPIRMEREQHITALEPFRPDDFAAWVINQGRVLNLDEENMHFAARHNLASPQPRPAAWLGVPLLTGDTVNGVMVLQRFGSGRPFSLWSQEVLLAIAGQASAAIQNARLYSEVLRLYNLTDEALAERVQQLQALLDSTHEGILMLDTAGRVALLNPVAARLLGRPRDELLQERLDPGRAAPALGYTAEALRATLRGLREGDVPASGSTIFERRLPAGDNGEGAQRRFIERHEGPVLTGEGQLLGWLMIFSDVTEEQERAEWRLNATRMIVHDLRNPITTLSSTLNMISAGLPQPADPQLETLAAGARRGCDDMLDMVDSLMDVTRLEAGQLVVDAEAMHLPPLLARVLEHVRPLALQKEIALAQEVAPELPPVWGDEEILRRVLVNLLDNALKFTPAGGEIRVRLRPEAAGNATKPGVRCIIEDTGPGIPGESKEQIFDRFVRINAGGAQVRGTGLGLTFCKLAVEAHGGRIWVEDRPEGGSRFVFVVPGIPEF